MRTPWKAIFRVFIIEKECFFMTQKQKTHRIAVAALLAAVAAVLQFVEFSIPVMPAFIKLDISDLPALLGTFSLGPVYGVAIQLVKNLLHLPFGSSAGVGELSNFLLGAVFAFIAGIVYKKHKNRGGALWGSVAGAAAMAVITHQLFHRLSRLCGAVRPAAGGHCGDVSGDPRDGGAGADLQRAAELPDGVQRAVHTVQGIAGRGAVLPDLQAAEPAAA